MKHIRIVKVPPGEAPKRVRSAWVGVTLPLADIQKPQPTVWITTGVLGKDRGLLTRFKRLFGVLVDQPEVASVYVVNTIAAVEALRAHSPIAARWWERNTPHLLKEGQQLGFHAWCCEEMAEALEVP
jgi:hypothetical protein